MAQHNQLTNEDFVQLAFVAINEKRFIRLVLSQPVGGSTAEVSKVSIRLVRIQNSEQLQFAAQIQKQESHENLDIQAARARVIDLLGTRFRKAHLFCTDADFSAKAKASGAVKCVKKKPSLSQSGQVASHNRSKSHLIPEGQPCQFLIEIGVMTAAGQVRAKKYDKFRQINRYLEFVNDIVGSLSATSRLRIVDFGCGKSYLTFALHHLLTNIHDREVDIVGLDLKASVIEHCNEIAQRLGCSGLSFRQGDIRDHVESKVDLCVSLHACDTATDVALSQALTWDSTVILAVPCCQHEVASKMSSSFANSIQRHGIHKERLATMATDSLRALALEASGYRTQVLEFIDTEHTPKNVLIRAVKRTQVNEEFAQQKAIEYQSFKDELSLKDIATDAVLKSG